MRIDLAKYRVEKAKEKITTECTENLYQKRKTLCSPANSKSIQSQLF